MAVQPCGKLADDQGRRKAVKASARFEADRVATASAKASETCGERGYDAGKKINGRKRHILVDTLGLLLWVTVLRPTCRIAKARANSWPKPTKSMAGCGVCGPMAATRGNSSTG